MKLFKCYKRRIWKRIDELIYKRNKLIELQKDIRLSIKPKEFIHMKLDIDDYNARIDELKNLLK